MGNRRCGPPEGLTQVEQAVWWLTTVVRLLVMLLGVATIIAFCILMGNADSSKLNFMGVFFSYISYTAYIILLLLIIVTQLEIEFTMKHLTLLFYWPVKSTLLVFMGVQILNLREQQRQADLDSSIQIFFANFAGYFYIVAGVIFLVMSLLKMNKSDLSQFADDAREMVSNVAQEPGGGGGGGGGGWFGSKKKKKTKEEESAKKALGDTLLDEVVVDDDAQAARPAVPDTDGTAYPFASDMPRQRGESGVAGAGGASSSLDPFSPNYNAGAPASSSAAAAEPTATYAPPQVPVDDDIQKRRRQEEEELEAMYAQAATQQDGGGAGGGSKFEAAD